MHVEVGRRGGLDLIEDGAELLTAVAFLAGPDHGSGLHVQSRKQIGRAVALTIVRHALGLTGAHGQHGRGARDGLDLGLLIDAQHQRPRGWGHVEPHHVSDLVDKGRIGGELERLVPVRPKAKGTPARPWSGSSQPAGPWPGWTSAWRCRAASPA